jgi:hypothetical protein
MNKDPFPMCHQCGTEHANVTTWKRTVTPDAVVKGPALNWCYECYDDRDRPRKVSTALKSLTRLTQDLREHAYRYTLDDGQLAADLRQAANYLEAVAND